jgi:Skp family chaperone for outer membrane proteins
MMRQLEKERSELSVRATMAEEQLKNLHEQMNTSIQNYQRKISELKKALQDARGGRPFGEGNSRLEESRSRF